MTFDELKNRQNQLNLQKNAIGNLIGRGQNTDLANSGNTTLQAIQRRKEEIASLKRDLENRRGSTAQVTSQRQNIERKIQTYSASIVSDVSEAMRNNSLEVVFVIDKSGSCRGTEENTIKGYNHFIEKEKAKGLSKTLVSVDLFDSDSQLIFDRLSVKEIPSTFRYEADGGSTALYDSLANRISAVEKKHKLEGNNAPNHTLFVIMTDGFDNDSKEVTEDKIRSIIKAKKEIGWEFILLANLADEKQVQQYAQNLGVSSDRACLYLSGNEALNFVAIADVVSSIQTTGTININWDEKIKKTTDRTKANFAIESNDENTLGIECNRGRRR